MERRLELPLSLELVPALLLRDVPLFRVGYLRELLDRRVVRVRVLFRLGSDVRVEGEFGLAAVVGAGWLFYLGVGLDFRKAKNKTTQPTISDSAPHCYSTSSLPSPSSP